jgi:membrane-bound lytic murein transglycosylase D
VEGTETPEAAPSEAQPTTEAAPSAPDSESIVHTVKRGETLSSIASRYGTTVKALRTANNIKNASLIRAGQKIKIPGPGGSTSEDTSSGGSTSDSGCRVRHNVKSGEWVWQIAREYDVSPYDILAANGLTVRSANPIHPGDVLCIP